MRYTVKDVASKLGADDKVAYLFLQAMIGMGLAEKVDSTKNPSGHGRSVGLYAFKKGAGEKLSDIFKAEFVESLD